MIPAPVKLFKLLINELGTQLENSATAQEDNEEDSDSDEVSGNLCMFVGTCRVCACVRASVGACVRACACLDARACVRACVCRCANVRAYMCGCVCLCVCMFGCMDTRYAYEHVFRLCAGE